jgi:hypothetical protein
LTGLGLSVLGFGGGVGCSSWNSGGVTGSGGASTGSGSSSGGVGSGSGGALSIEASMTASGIASKSAIGGSA